MRVGNHSGSTAIPIDPSQCFMLRTLTVYVDRLLAMHGTVEHETLDMLYWLLGPEIVREDLIPLAAMLSGEGRKRRFEPDMTEEIRHNRDFSHLVDTALRKLGRNEQSAVADLFRGLLKKRQDMLKYKGISDIERNLASSLLRVGKQCYSLRTRPEDRARLESHPSAVAGAFGWAGLNVLPLSELVIHWPQCDKLQGVWGTGPPGVRTD